MRKRCLQGAMCCAIRTLCSKQPCPYNNDDVCPGTAEFSLAERRTSQRQAAQQPRINFHRLDSQALRRYRRFYQLPDVGPNSTKVCRRCLFDLLAVGIDQQSLAGMGDICSGMLRLLDGEVARCADRLCCCVLQEQLVSAVGRHFSQQVIGRAK